MKTIFITAFHSFITKNILNTELFDELKKDNLRIVLFVPLNKKDYYDQIYSSENVIIEGIDISIIKNNKLETFLHRLSFLIQYSHYLDYKKKERLNSNRTLWAYLKYFFEILFTKIFSRKNLVNRFFRFIDYHFYRKDILKSHIGKYNPDCIFATDIFDETDTVFMREAKFNGIFLIGMIRSWDNCFSKGILRVMPDKLIVNNEVIKKDVVNIHNVPESNVFIGGLPQYDNFIKNKRSERISFFTRIGADESKSLILYAPAGSILSDTDWQICEIIDKAISDGKLKNVQVLVRNHPNHPADLEQFANNNNFIIELPGKVFNNNMKETELTNSDSVHLADTLYYSDVVIWVATTLGLDALVFDKPQVVVNFDGYKKKKYIDSVKKYHHEGHMKRMLDLGGMKIANNSEELIEYVERYLENPKIDKKYRDMVVDQQLFKLDGKSGARIANYIINKLNIMGE